MFELYWHCAGQNKTDEAFVEKSLSELHQLLSEPPVGRGLIAKRLGKEGQDIVEQWLSDPDVKAVFPHLLSEGSFLSKNMPQDEGWSPLLVFCQPDSLLAKRLKRVRYGAAWGYCEVPTISAVYEPSNKHILWHETLHLFDVDDCYDYNDPNNGTTCELPDCLMQYAPSSQTVGKWPFLCKKAVEKLRCWPNHAETMDQPKL